MNKLAWSASLVVLGAIAGGDSACTVTFNGGDDGGGSTSGSASGSASGSTSGGSSGTTSGSTSGSESGSTSGSANGSPSDAGGQGDTGATPDGDGGGCSVISATGNAACDQCMNDNCCSELVACANEPAEAGPVDCPAIIDCYNTCLYPPPGAGYEAGTPASCMPSCTTDAGGALGQTDYNNLYNCAVSHCGTQCQ